MTIESIEARYPVTYVPTSYHGVRAANLPISMRDEVLAAYRAAGIPVRIRFRGPRAHSVGRQMPTMTERTYARTRYQAQSYCLREDADRFTVYNR